MFDKDNPEIKSAKGFKRMKDERPDWVKALKQPGRPIAENPKVSVTIRLDPDVLEYFKAAGKGYQSRINDALRNAMR